MSWADIAVVLIVLAFVGWEIYAHYFGHNITAHTLSDLIGRMEAHLPWTRFIVSAAVLYLWYHLVVREYKLHKKEQ